QRHPLPGQGRQLPRRALAPALLLHPVPRAADRGQAAGRQRVHRRRPADPQTAQRLALIASKENWVSRKLFGLVRSGWKTLSRPSRYYSLGFLSIGGFVCGILFWGGFNTAL